VAIGAGLAGCRSGEQPVTTPVPESWAVICAWLREQAGTLAFDLDRALESLRESASEHDPSLLERLDEPAPTDRPPGYAILPEVLDDVPFTVITPRQRRYALKPISENFVTSFRDGRVLAERSARSGAATLEQAVRDYERVSGDLDNLLDHLAYHEQWQPEATAYQAFFAERNALVADVREMVALEALEPEEVDSERLDALRASVAEGMSSMHAAVDLRLERTDDGAWILPVIVHTDIVDADFRAAFVEAVEAAWNGAEAAQQSRFSLSVRLVLHEPDELYPEGAPPHGEPIVLEDHLARFPADTLVMTTGAASTHAWKGRRMLLGPTPITPRTLAHEFGHLLGFADGYLRGYDGSPGEPFGVVFVEWTGLRNDLMGNPAGGRVTQDLIDQLIETYDEPAPDAP
jgi:hypothetical protein